DEEKVENLRAEIAALEDELKRLREAEENMTGNNIREFIGDGNRQYLTGLILGGNRILILVDISGSMLDNTIVNIIRRRNMPERERLNAPKWQQLLKTIDWLTTQLPVPSQYQIYVFNNEIRPLLPGTDNQWLEVADAEQLGAAVDALKNTVPAEGTNLENVFAAIKAMPSPPDNVFLLTDGLPTLGSRSRASGTISGRDREELFERAMRELPKGIPVNVIMLPLEGDPAAPGWYWQLAMQSGGSFMMPSPDWP
ncbi:MAG: vWA domain-containing protein, partial [Pseudomonadota bacterium]|nr:vWA domain-containing protein [Pseudomonadota bacterium]